MSTTPYTKHTTHTDALDTLGSIIGPNEARDAIHLAVFNAVAGAYMKPGTHVMLMPDKATAVPAVAGEGIGIVDPFLTQKVKFGERFWLVVYPRQITSLRHVWEHPAFQPSEAPAAAPAADAMPNASEAWLRNFADEVDADYDEMMAVAATHCEGSASRWGDYLCDGGKWEGQGTPAEFWTHFAAVTGKKPSTEYGTPGIFSCSC